MLNKHIEPERVEMVMKMVNGEDVGSVPVGKESARSLAWSSIYWCALLMNHGIALLSSVC